MAKNVKPAAVQWFNTPLSTTTTVTGTGLLQNVSYDETEAVEEVPRQSDRDTIVEIADAVQDLGWGVQAMRYDEITLVQRKGSRKTGVIVTIQGNITGRLLRDILAVQVGD